MLFTLIPEYSLNYTDKIQQFETYLNPYLIYVESMELFHAIKREARAVQKF